MQHLEDDEQMALIEWAQLTRMPKSAAFIADYLIHIPNGGKRNAREAARLKRMGVKPGVSDLLLAYPQASMHGLWIEMKKRRRDFSSETVANMAVTDYQAEWLTRMEDAGYMCEVCYGADEAIERIKCYLGI